MNIAVQQLPTNPKKEKVPPWMGFSASEYCENNSEKEKVPDSGYGWVE